MSLIGSYIDNRTIAGLTNGQSTSYAHGLPSAPDFCIVQFASTLATSNTVAMITVLQDGTNVTVRNNGTVTSPTLRIVAVMANSTIR